MQPLFLTLGHDHSIDLLQHIAEEEFFLADNHTPGFDSAHVKYIVDQTQKVSRASANLLKIITRFVRERFIVQSQTVQSYDRIHRRADLMAHT